MLTDLFPLNFSLNPIIISGCSLWALALYVSLPKMRNIVTQGLDWWFNFADRSLYTSQQEFEKTRKARESQNAFYASLFSILPFLLLGVACHYGVEYGLGRTWAVSLGFMACLSCGIYELGKQSENN